MKSKLMAAVAIVAVVFTMSCKKGGMSEETKTKMSTFETEWKTMTDQMTAWGTTMNTAMGEMDKMMMESMPMADSMSKKMCDDVMMRMEAMKTMYKSSMDSVTAGMAQYTEWKKTSIEAKDDAATSAGLDEWNAKLGTYTSMMADWDPALGGLKDACTMACDMAKQSATTDKKKK